MSATAATVRAQKAARLVVDPVTTCVVAALVLLGLVMVTSASVTLGAREGDPFFFLERQFALVLAGCAIAAVVMRIPTATWERLGVFFLVVAMLLLVLVLIPGIGHEVNGSRRWLRVAGLNFQASEGARVLLLIYLCGYVVRREEELRTKMVGVLKPLAVLGVAAVLLLLEPDFGSAVVLLAVGVAVLFLAGIRWLHFLALAVVGVVALSAIAVSSSYRVKRLTAFMDPWADPFNTGFQLTQSLIAIGRGEWLGVGLGASVQKLFYLPEAHTDFVFAVLAEELGFAGIVLIVALVLALSVRSLQIAKMAAQQGLKFQAYLAAAFGIWFGLQALINMGVNMGLLPTKGLTLPLVSYGRSSLLVTLGWLGILLRVYHEVQTSRAALVRGGPKP
ncbi:MAG: putative lipid II flippase FtsW [Pseudomonadota bacterium]